MKGKYRVPHNYPNQHIIFTLEIMKSSLYHTGHFKYKVLRSESGAVEIYVKSSRKAKINSRQAVHGTASAAWRIGKQLTS